MKLAYRPDIDGLRAVAVASVVAFHAFPESFKGGFVGVDVFFVISGFLISSIILSNLSSGDFSFRDFYARRIKRIFPALILMLSTSLAIGWFFLLPDEFVQLGKHTIAGLTFLSNIALWRESGYFDTASNSKPLLHLWSLGIEEQFYIFWPLFLALAFLKKIAPLKIVLGLGLASFVANIAFINSHPSETFYLPMTRFWEILLGCYLALAQSRAKNQVELRSWAGLLLISLAIIIMNEGMAFPGWWALLPCLGTFLVIQAGPETWLNKKILSHRSLVTVGLISYPLYLWHWPLLVFLSIIHGKSAPPTEQRILAVVLSFILAWLTFRFVEIPLRNGRLRFLNKTPILVCAAIAVLLISTLILKSKIPPASARLNVEEYMTAHRDWDFPGDMQRFFHQGARFYKIGSSSKSALFIGDSNVQQYGPRIESLCPKILLVTGHLISLVAGVAFLFQIYALRIHSIALCF